MKLTSSLRSNFKAGRFEEFLDRAEDHLKYGLGAQLSHRNMNARGADYRKLAYTSFEITQRMKRPGEALAVRIAEGRLLFGVDFWTDQRFSAATQIITDTVCTPDERDLKFAELIDASIPFWGIEQRLHHLLAFEELRETNTTAMQIRSLAALFESRMIGFGLCDGPQFGAFMRDVTQLAQTTMPSLTDEQFRFVALSLCYGPRFFNDPFQSNLNFDPANTIQAKAVLSRCFISS